ncbi:transcriptional regulator, MarR family [Candidatus Caldarchaeum subterraneum]|uniref:Transcriptional regulator, MarR family n=1 Tax=Caldiarchaeum subterraneum TaxID=311458 RepID=E6N8S4_CALS0|nr:transcriptional regulator, MarR family [Candidatus Caldarchaeum subterraneum]BAJ48724.1 transcriptional regulator, MarR family [Candidatus Caldarchaeum subterraneum]BAJ49727.1 transcriptional regulator, MarR family [Candidatus Caldarchaeum subterraneum]BAJ51396.1 transcriptional regulator, MarR family [Candidatus Caldarchaeum subterraneum]GBC72520.1 putative HTH-type transcriptional regulator YybR [archaeon HR03]
MARAKSLAAGDVCPIVSATKLIGSVWSMVIISYLVEGPKGFNELLKAVPGLNSKTLSRTLKNLQKKGLVERNVVSLQPFSVAYSLTPMAKELAPILEQLREWGSKWAMQNTRNISL